MDIGRQLIRFILPGGYSLAIGAFYELVYEWAWKKPVHDMFSTTSSDPITTIGGALIIGFVVYEVYYAFYRPSIRLAIRLPLPCWDRNRRLRIGLRVRALCPCTIYTADIGGTVLRGLDTVPNAMEALRNSCDLAADDDLAVLPSASDERELERRTTWFQNRTHAMLNLLHLPTDAKGTALERSYRAIDDLYHTLGACRAALIAVSLAAGADVAARHRHAFDMYPGRSIGVTVFSLLMIFVSLRVIRVNRRNCWLALTATLRNGLRTWAILNPEIITQLAAAPLDGKGDDVEDSAEPSFMLGTRPYWRAPYSKRKRRRSHDALRRPAVERAPDGRTVDRRALDDEADAA